MIFATNNKINLKTSICFGEKRFTNIPSSNVIQPIRFQTHTEKNCGIAYRSIFAPNMRSEVFKRCFKYTLPLKCF